MNLIAIYSVFAYENTVKTHLHNLIDRIFKKRGEKYDSAD